MANGIICQACGIEAPTRSVEFYQNIGMLIMRRHQRIKGMLCKRCINEKFWKMTGTTLFLGPWGMISLIVSPFFILNNLVRYVGVLGMPAVPPDAKVPVLTEQDAARLRPYTKSIIERLNAKEALTTVANDVAIRAKVTPGQVVKYVAALAKPKPKFSQPPTFGFPVQPAQPQAAIPLEGKSDENAFGTVNIEEAGE
jgi:hypothetical protein